MATSDFRSADDGNFAPGVILDSSGYWDEYRGTAEALISAGLVRADQFPGQPGMPKTSATFYDGQRVGRGKGTYGKKDEKYMRVLTSGGEFAIWKGITSEVAAEREAARRMQEREEAITNARELGQQPLSHQWEEECESWEGTKAQLQAEGIGVGCAFPGEPDTGDSIDVTHPQGFGVTISSHWDSKKANAGIHTRFRARSRYVEHPKYDKQKVVYAPGVTKVIEPWNTKSDYFIGTAEALVACGLARGDQFPGQPGRGSTQCSYLPNGAVAGTSSNGEATLTISRKGKHRFCIERPASAEETARREAEYEERAAQEKKANRIAMASRMRLRDVQNGPSTIDEFRKEKAADAERMIDVLWSMVFNSSGGQFAFEIKEGDDVYDELGKAFGSIRDAVQNARVVRDLKTLAVIEGGRKLVAAKANAPLQNFLRLVVENR